MFIDLGMWLTHTLIPETWPLRIVMTLIGCTVMAFGITLEITSNTMVIPGEGFVLALAVVLKKPFSSLKIANDVGFVAAAAVVGLCFLGTCYGIREATLVSAVIVGLCVRWMRPLFRMDGV